jgi:hypothetical protein
MRSTGKTAAFSADTLIISPARTYHLIYSFGSHNSGNNKSMTKQSDTKTIHEFLAENPNVDVSAQWERFWSIHGKIADRIIKYFDAQLIQSVFYAP